MADIQLVAVGLDLEPFCKAARNRQFFAVGFSNMANRAFQASSAEATEVRQFI
jgi:hypothetical protein